MAHPVKNLMSEISTRLKADSPVIALLHDGSADYVIYGFNVQTDDFAAQPKPFISISPNDAEDTRQQVTNKARFAWENKIIVEYIKEDVFAESELLIWDDAEKIEAVLLGDNLDNPIFSGEKALLLDDGVERLFIKEDDVLKLRYTLNYQYLENI